MNMIIVCIILVCSLIFSILWVLPIKVKDKIRFSIKNTKSNSKESSVIELSQNEPSKEVFGIKFYIENSDNTLKAQYNGSLYTFNNYNRISFGSKKIDSAFTIKIFGKATILFISLIFAIILLIVGGVNLNNYKRGVAFQNSLDSLNVVSTTNLKTTDENFYNMLFVITDSSSQIVGLSDIVISDNMVVAQEFDLDNLCSEETLLNGDNQSVEELKTIRDIYSLNGIDGLLNVFNNYYDVGINHVVSITEDSLSNFIDFDEGLYIRLTREMAEGLSININEGDNYTYKTLNGQQCISLARLKTTSDATDEVISTNYSLVLTYVLQQDIFNNKNLLLNFFYSSDNLDILNGFSLTFNLNQQTLEDFVNTKEPYIEYKVYPIVPTIDQSGEKIVTHDCVSQHFMKLFFEIREFL